MRQEHKWITKMNVWFYIDLHPWVEKQKTKKQKTLARQKELIPSASIFKG